MGATQDIHKMNMKIIVLPKLLKSSEAVIPQSFK